MYDLHQGIFFAHDQRAIRIIMAPFTGVDNSSIYYRRVKRMLHLYPRGRAMGLVNGRKLRIKTYQEVQCDGCGEIVDLAYEAMQDMVYRKVGLTGYCAYTRKQETLHAVSSDRYCVPRSKQNTKLMVLDA